MIFTTRNTNIIQSNNIGVQPIDILFFGIIDNDILPIMCDETSFYVHQKLAALVRRKIRMSRWKDVCIKEMKNVLLLFGLF